MKRHTILRVLIELVLFYFKWHYLMGLAQHIRVLIKTNFI